MMRPHTALLAPLLTTLAALPAAATRPEPQDNPTLGLGVGVGPSAVDAERPHIDLRLHGFYGVGGWRFGAELYGSVEGDDGGCPAPGATGNRPAIAEICFEPSLALHPLVGHAWGDEVMLRIEAGAGVARRWQVVGDVPDGRWALSWVGRGSLTLPIGDLFGGRWGIGPSVELAGFDAAPRWGAGVVFEAVSFD